MNRQLFLFILLLTAALQCAADFSRGAGYNPNVVTDRFEQRRQYLDAVGLIQSGQFSRLAQVKPGLRTYALYPYLEYMEMTYRISRYSEDEILAFTNQYKDTPLVEPLLAHWLSSLAKNGQWETFLRHYGRVTPSKTLACHHAYGLYKAGQSEEAMAEAQELWTVGFSQPDECDPIFNVWRGANGITPEVAWRRFALSLQENESDLSRYLLKFVGRDDKTFAENYWQVHFKPQTIERFASFSKDHPRNREIILHGAKRLARSNPEAAFTTLKKYEPMQQFDPELLEAAYAYIGIQMARKTFDPAFMDTLPVDLHKHPDLAEARIRQSLKSGDWRSVMVLINLLPAEAQADPRWQYWKARVLGQSADESDQKAARDIMLALSQERTFYGFVAADILQAKYSYQDEPTPVTLEQILSLEESPGVQRALELYALGDKSRARREWYYSTKDFSFAEREVAAKVALRWGWYKAAIQTMIDAGAWNHLDYRFPMAYADHFIAHASRANIPVQWSLAIARQESAFMPDAKSSAGALGLMQLMPGTAKQVAGQLGVSYANDMNLIEPDLNIRLGSNYLGQMLRRFDNNRILASAAYNAGPGRVKEWLDTSVPFDVWIEIIPFSETRSYVQNVLMFSTIYSRRMDENQPLIYQHERDYFSPQQITALQVKPVRPPEKS